MKYAIPFALLLLAACGNLQSNEEVVVEAEVIPDEEIQADTELMQAETAPEVEDTPSLEVIFESLDYKGDTDTTRGLVSPDGSIELIFEEVDPTAMSLSIKKGDKIMEIPDLYFGMENAAWSRGGRFVFIVNEDMYAGSGASDFTILDAETGQYVVKSVADFIEGMDLGGRSMFRIYNQGGLYEPKVFGFSISVNYLGESGHPGINSNRQAELGDNFGKDDVILIGHFKATIDG